MCGELALPGFHEDEDRTAKKGTRGSSRPFRRTLVDLSYGFEAD